MLGTSFITRAGRLAGVVCLALLLGLGSLVPLAAAALSGSASSCCCGKNAHACCRRHHSGNGPAIDATSCMNGCGCAAFSQGSGVAGAVRPVACQGTFPASAAAVSPVECPASSVLLPHGLRQRPPPSSSSFRNA